MGRCSFPFTHRGKIMKENVLKNGLLGLVTVALTGTLALLSVIKSKKNSSTASKTNKPEKFEPMP